jgi:hypothetical protein
MRIDANLPADSPVKPALTIVIFRPLGLCLMNRAWLCIRTGDRAGVRADLRVVMATGSSQLAHPAP